MERNRDGVTAAGSTPPDLIHAIDGDHLEICWAPDGEAFFYPDTADPKRLARRLAEIVEILAEHPEAILCAAGACGGRGHAH